MARTDDDSWDLASSVGATATMVAVGRALAGRAPNALIDDPFAEPLVRAVGMEFFVRVLDGEINASAMPNASPERFRAMVDGMAVRTRFFDDYFTAAAQSGIRQVVILASGLDARAYRLDWPAGTTLYEIDQPDVIAFKTRVLDELGAAPRAARRTVGIDLREDWPAALRAAGFDPSAPTAWLAEGLLIYLPPPAQDALFDTITALSAPGSAVATEYVPGIMDFDADTARESSEALRAQGLDLDMASLIYPGQRSHVMDYLADKGWTVAGTPRDELFTRHSLAIPAPEDGDALGHIVYVSAVLPG